MRHGLRGVVFDKDGTLFDFHATWGAWASGFIAQVARGDAALAEQLAEALDFDLPRGRFRKSSRVISGTMEVVVDVLHRCLPRRDRAQLHARVLASTAAAPQVPAAPLPPLLARLGNAGLALGLATNDAEAPARAHLERAGIHDRFAFIAGYDSGHGAKPGPGQLITFCRRTGLVPAEVLMVGDSLHDLASARAAGMRSLAVLTGPAEAGDLAPHADAVLPDVGALPGWLGLPEAGGGRREAGGRMYPS